MGRQTTPDIYKLLRENNKNLRNINKSICSTGTAGAGGAVGDATEATLQDILAELKDDRAITEAIVKDSNDLVLIRRTEVNQDTGVKTTTYLDPDTAAVVVPTFPLVINGADSDFELVVFDDLVDDVAGDGTGDLIPFNEVYKVETNTDVKTLIWTVDNKGVDYVLQGTKRNISEIGVAAKTQQHQLVLTGANWSPTEVMMNYSYTVISIADTNNPPTFTTNSGAVIPLFLGESGSYSVIKGTDKLDITNIQITSQTGDIIKITYDSIVAI